MTNETPSGSSIGPKSPRPRETEAPKKAKVALAILVGVLLLATVAGLVWSNHFSPSATDSSLKFSSSLQKLEGGGLTIEFTVSRALPAGVGLQNLLDSVPGHERVVGARADGVATYQVDQRGDWDLSSRDGRTILTVPTPELKSVVMTRDSLKFDMNGAALAPEDAELARELIEEKLPDLMRQDEEARRSERLSAIRERVKKFALEALHDVSADTLDVVFPGDGTTTESPEDAE